MKQITYSPNALGQFICRVRKNKKLTQSEAGETFKINQTTVSSIECGAEGTRLGTLFRLLAALDLEMVIRSKKAFEEKEVDW